MQYPGTPAPGGVPNESCKLCFNTVRSYPIGTSDKVRFDLNGRPMVAPTWYVGTRMCGLNPLRLHLAANPPLSQREAAHVPADLSGRTPGKIY